MLRNRQTRLTHLAKPSRPDRQVGGSADGVPRAACVLLFRSRPANATRTMMNNRRRPDTRYQIYHCYDIDPLGRSLYRRRRGHLHDFTGPYRISHAGDIMRSMRSPPGVRGCIFNRRNAKPLIFQPVLCVFIVYYAMNDLSRRHTQIMSE